MLIKKYKIKVSNKLQEQGNYLGNGTVAVGLEMPIEICTFPPARRKGHFFF